MMENSQIKIVRFLRRYRIVALIILLAWLTFLSYCLRDLKINNSLQVWFPKDDPSYVRYKDFLHSFGSDEVVITLITDSIPYYDPVRLEQTDQLCHEVESLAGIGKTLCVTNLPLLLSGNKLVTIGEILKDSVLMHQAQKKLERRAENSLIQRFTGTDGFSLVLYSWMDTLPELEMKRGDILHSIDSLARKSLLCRNGRIEHGGFGVIYQALNSETLQESPLMIGLSYLFIFAAVFYFTRRFVWVIISGLAVTFANITVFGIMALTGQPVNVVSIAIPPLIMVTGVATSIHIARYIPESNQAMPYKNHYVLSVLILLSFPLIFNALTTAGGFLSLAAASMKITRLYGIFAALGVVSSLIYSLLLVIILTPASFRPEAAGRRNVWIQKKLKGLLLFSIQQRKTIIGLSILITIIGLIGIIQLKLDTESFEFLSRKSPVREYSRDIEAQIGYYIPFDFVISYGDRNWKQRDFLVRMKRLQDTIEKDGRFGYAYSIADIVLEAYSIYHGTENSDGIFPERLKQQQILYYASQIQQSEAYASLVSDKGRKVRLTVTGPIVSARTMTGMAKDIEQMARDVFGETVDIHPAGYLSMYSRLVDRLLHDQVTSISIALLVIFILIGLFLRSWQLSLTAVPSNVLPIVAILGIMGYSGIFIDTATVTIAAAIIGIIVDDTIHMLYTLKEHIRSGSTPDDVAQHMAERTGEAVVYTSLILCGGFMILGTSQLPSISITGWLTALTIAIALAADLMLLPAVSYYFYIKRRLKSI
jgi:predicted RND superfamily exporter protein